MSAYPFIIRRHPETGRAEFLWDMDLFEQQCWHKQEQDQQEQDYRTSQRTVPVPCPVMYVLEARKPRWPYDTWLRRYRRALDDLFNYITRQLLSQENMLLHPANLDDCSVQWNVCKTKPEFLRYVYNTSSIAYRHVRFLKWSNMKKTSVRREASRMIKMITMVTMM